jgi:hypothetical protein
MVRTCGIMPWPRHGTPPMAMSAVIKCPLAGREPAAGRPSVGSKRGVFGTSSGVSKLPNDLAVFLQVTGGYKGAPRRTRTYNPRIKRPILVMSASGLR